MTDYNLNELAQASLEFSKAASDYGALKVIFGVFLVVVLIMCLMFFYQIWNTQKRLGSIEKASDQTLKYFSDLNNRTIGRQEAKNIICETMKKSEALMKYYILKIRLEDPDTGEEYTLQKIRSIVDNDYSSRMSFLSRFLCHSKQVSTVINIDDNQAIMNLMQEWVYKSGNGFTVSLMAQAVDIYFEGIKIKAQGKVDSL